MDFIERAKYELAILENRAETLARMRNKNSARRLHVKVRPDGRVQLYYNSPSNYSLRYINTKSLGIAREILGFEYSNIALPKLNRNITLLREFLKQYEDLDNAVLLSELPKSHRVAKEYIDNYEKKHLDRTSFTPSCPIPQSEKGGPASSFPHTTTFGLHTRSKGESMIAEELFRAVPEMFYEKRLVLSGLDSAKYENALQDALAGETDAYDYDEYQYLQNTYSKDNQSFGRAETQEVYRDRFKSGYQSGFQSDYRNNSSLLLPPAYYTRLAVTIYPDFTIPLPNGKCIYWEHKGMRGEPDYAINDFWRTQLYFHNGIYEPVNLISTCDGPDGNIDMKAVRRIIEGIILPQCR